MAGEEKRLQEEHSWDGPSEQAEAITEWTRRVGEGKPALKSPTDGARKLCVLIILLRNRHRKQTGRSNKETTMRSTQRTKET